MSHDFPVKVDTLHIGEAPQKIVFYPRIRGIRNRIFEKRLNDLIVKAVQTLIDTQVGNMPTTITEMLGTYEIKNNQREVLSLLLSNYTFHHQAAHGMTYLKSLTFDLQKEKLCTLADLFKPGSPYVDRISTLIKEQIEKRGISLLNEFTQIKPDQDFYIADKTLVIYFQLYDITPYAFGFPMFPVSVYDLIDIIEENGPLGRLATNR
ncbi:DUF3298 and DUF4163 domain-containing protein [Robertmurraya massiliosenegalensis]|uniref:DUF3298 and DUF4163 domain-containing protein n=1 Tax=Robertmurraya massiliosenegalensis TaxID=1287657 RepID=UPI00030D2B0E|nr:DUF3298 and DUF4163 domain-containing protein [Robertmurraya massiliosenegalensis]